MMQRIRSALVPLFFISGLLAPAHPLFFLQAAAFTLKSYNILFTPLPLVAYRGRLCTEQRQALHFFLDGQTLPRRCLSGFPVPGRQRRARHHGSSRPFSSLIVPPLDDIFVGKYSVYWTIRDFQRKWMWRQREDNAPPLRTSRFPFAGINNFYMQFWPSGHKSGKPGYVSIEASAAETWREFHNPINLFVGSIKRGPFAFRSPEYFQAANSFCRIEDLDLRNDEITVGFEVASEI